MQGKHRRFVYGLPFLTLVLAAVPVGAQAVDAPDLPLEASALRVYLDCRCDTDYIRREIPFVTYVRDRQAAQVHLLVTDQQSGAGGRQYGLHFIGQGEFGTRADTLIYDSPAGDSEELRRRGLARAMKVGLLPYLSRTPQAAGIEITYAPPRVAAPLGAAGVRRDPWNYWNFRANLSGNLNDEALRSSYSANGTFTANRTTDQWKLNIRLYARKNYSERELSDHTVIDSNHNWSVDGLLVGSVGPHLSLGATGRLESSPVYSNYDYAFRFAPAVEYNLYPYSESSRRALVVRYSTGIVRYDYNEITTYLRTTETLTNHALRVNYAVEQPWGGSQIGAEYSSYLHDLGLNRLAIDGDFDINVTRGLSFNVGSRFERVRDQISLRLEELSDEDVLLGRRQQGTGHRLRINMGMTYRFGSIFNNVVNTRFDDGGGGGGGPGGGGGGNFF